MQIWKSWKKFAVVDKYDMKKLWECYFYVGFLYIKIYNFFQKCLEEWFAEYLMFYIACKIAMIAHNYKFGKFYKNCFCYMVDNMKIAPKMKNFNDLRIEILLVIMKKYAVKPSDFTEMF